MKAFEIVSCTPPLQARFAEIWVPWLRSMTGKEPEPEDLLAVGDPEAFYIRGGGTVLFALQDGDPLGVVAVRNLGGGIYEFGKLVVLERARGLGVGRGLVEACVRFARAVGGRLLMLQSFRRLEVALRMYERMGFVPMTPPPQMLVLSRTEIVMGLPLAVGPSDLDRPGAIPDRNVPRLAGEIERFVRDFEARTLPKPRWTHQAHLLVGLWYLSKHPAAEALEVVRARISAYNVAVGTANTDDSGYHETLTRLYLEGIAAHVARHSGKSLPDQLALLLESPLARSDWPLQFYSRDRLFSVLARRQWLEPDLTRQPPFQES